MVARLVNNAFIQTFKDFLSKHGYELHNNFFMKYENGIFIRVFAVCRTVKKGTKIDILVIPTPTFCKISDEKSCAKNELSISKLIGTSTASTDIRCEASNENIFKMMTRYLSIYKKNYNTFFYYRSICDYAEKITAFYNKVVTDSIIGTIQYNNNIISNIDFCELAYTWYRTGRMEKCRQAVYHLVVVYREYLYYKFEKNNMLYDEKAHRDHNSEYNRLLDDYKRLVAFAEAIVDGNRIYLKHIDEQYSIIETNSIDYIRSLLVG